MPIDPNMAMMQYGMGMAGPRMAGQPAPVFGPMVAAQRRPGAFQLIPPPRQQDDQPANSPTGQPTSQSAQQPPSLYDMMLKLGGMNPQQYAKAVQGPGAYGIPPQSAAYLGPLGFLGSLGLPGGPGWGGGQSGDK